MICRSGEAVDGTELDLAKPRIWFDPGDGTRHVIDVPKPTAGDEGTRFIERSVDRVRSAPSRCQCLLTASTIARNGHRFAGGLLAIRRDLYRVDLVMERSLLEGGFGLRHPPNRDKTMLPVHHESCIGFP